MHILVPQFIIDQYKKGEIFGELSAVGIFVDLSGFSSMTDNLMQLGQYGAEVLASIMRNIFDPMIQSVYQHNGFIANFAGDSFTAIFPISTEEKDEYLNPIAAVVEIQNKIAAISKQQTPKGEFNISVRAGVAVGTTSWGIIQDKNQERAAYYFRGSAIEGCIEAEKKAESGTIIIDDHIYSRLGKSIDTKPVSDHYQLVDLNIQLPETKPLPKVSPDLENAKRFYPESILLQNQTGEFRQVVNMFISLPTVRTEPQLEIFMQALFNLQDRYGGLLNRIDFGDKGAHLLLFWGAPVAYENDIGRALNFILTLQTETAIPIKAGITYRIAHAGFIGSAIREEYTCYGQGVNLAARFMEGAGRGEVWIDDQIAKRIEHYFDIEQVGEFSFKGFEKKQKVFTLYERLQQIESFFPGQFFNREKELNRLIEISSPLWEGKSQHPIIIFGEPGIGKSRVIHEFHHSKFLADKNFLWARCQTDQVLRRSFNPFRYWAKNYFGISDLQAEARNKRNFNRKIDRLISSIEDPKLASELDRTRTFLGSLVNLSWNDSLFEQLDPQGRYENTVISLITLLMAESRRQPVIINIEDIQWLDEDSKGLLRKLCRSLHAEKENNYPILIITTSRSIPDESSLGQGIRFHSLELFPLPSKEIIHLATDLLGGPLTQELNAAIIDLSEGNPYFAEQIILYLKEEDQLNQTSSGWSFVTKNTSFLPTDIRAVLVARLDQTEPEVKNIVLTASTLGREFKAPLLKKMVSTALDFEEILNKAEKASIWVSLTIDDYIFKSNLLRDAAYKMQTFSQRKKIHADAVRVLEELNQNNLSKVYHELAYHAENAELNEKAIQYYTGAGINAQENYQNSQSIFYFSKAIELSPEIHTPDYFKLLIHRERVYTLIGDREAQFADLKLAEEIASSLNMPELLAKINYRLAHYHFLVGKNLDSIQFSRKAVELAQESGSYEVEIESRNSWANSARHQGDYETARVQSDLGLKLAQKNYYGNGICLSLNNLSLIAIEQGNLPEAVEHLEQGLVTARKINSFQFEAQTLNNLGNVYGDLGDFSSAYQSYSQSLQIVQKIGTRMGEGLVTGNLGWVAGLLGDYSTAREHLEYSIRIGQELGDIYNQATPLVNLSLFASCQNETEVAKSYAQQGLALARETGNKHLEAFAATYLGHAVLATGLMEQAREWYQYGLDIRNELGQQNLAIEPLAGIAEIEYHTKNLSSALEIVEDIIDYLDGGGTLDGIDQPYRIYATSARILLDAHHPRAESFIQEAYTMLQTQAEKIKDEQSRDSFLSNVPFHGEIIRLYDQLDK